MNAMLLPVNVDIITCTKHTTELTNYLYQINNTINVSYAQMVLGAFLSRETG